MEQKTKTNDLKTTTPYAQYKNTEEWVIIEYLLNELENNQDIELKTAPEYVIGYLTKNLKEKQAFQVKKKLTEKKKDSKLSQEQKKLIDELLMQASKSENLNWESFYNHWEKWDWNKDYINKIQQNNLKNK